MSTVTAPARRPAAVRRRRRAPRSCWQAAPPSAPFRGGLKPDQYQRASRRLHRPGAGDGTAAPPPVLAIPLIEVSTLALRVHNRRVAAAPMSLDTEIIKGANKWKRHAPWFASPVNACPSARSRRRLLVGASRPAMSGRLALTAQACPIGQPRPCQAH